MLSDQSELAVLQQVLIKRIWLARVFDCYDVDIVAYDDGVVSFIDTGEGVVLEQHRIQDGTLKRG
jgi:hypothetical protein